MILELFITILVFALLLWLVLMFMWWQKEKGAHEPLAIETASTYFDKCTRLARRGWYMCTMYMRNISVWGNKKIAKIFFSIFPEAKPAFAKKDELAGLSHGPSSFFLLSISENRKKIKKSSLQKKIV